MSEVGFFQQINSNLDAKLDKYYLSSNFKQIKMAVKNNLNFLHLNISSLSCHFSKLHTLPTTSEIESDIIGITESRLKSNKNYYSKRLTKRLTAMQQLQTYFTDNKY